jgi:cardiolipin synthase
MVPDLRADGVVRVLRTDAASGRIDIFRAQIAAIRASRKRVWIQNPYFASDEIVRAVAAAAGRGADVRVVLPSRNDSTLMDANNLYTARELIDAGAKVFRYPGMTHMKVMLCDDWVTLGSANLDTLSMRINRELNIAFREPRAVREVARKIFEKDFRKSRRLRRVETDSPMAPLAESIADQL